MLRILPCIVLWLCITSTLSAEAIFQPLGDLAGGNFASYTWSVSPDGSVVVGAAVVVKDITVPNSVPTPFCAMAQ